MVQRQYDFVTQVIKGATRWAAIRREGGRTKSEKDQV